MKPKIFIGSSVEALEIANAIQQNLDYDAEVTVWSQGVFKLSSTTITDLIKIINNSDFAIFVFHPDDVAIIRDNKHSIVRDNVVFELGLSIGKLGQENVFYVLPNNIEIHLPSDLLGITAGKYNSSRSDKNLLAALGPFCNQVRARLKDFTYVNLTELIDETENARNLAVQRPFCFEYLLLAEMIESRIKKISSQYAKFKKGITYIKLEDRSIEEYTDYFQNVMRDFRQFVTIFSNLLITELQDALGPNGVPSKFSDLKSFAEDISSLYFELYQWELKHQSHEPPEELLEIKTLLAGITDVVTSQINILPEEIRRVVKAREMNSNSNEKVDLKFEFPPRIYKALEILQAAHKGNNS